MFGPRRIFQSRLRSLASPSSPARFPLPATRPFSTVPPAHPAREPSKWPRRLIYAALFGSLGVIAGQWMDDKVSSLALPGSEEDVRKMRQINYIFEHALPIVKELRNDPDFTEATVYENYSEYDKTLRLTSGPLGGSRGLALQRVFWNDKEKKAINVVYLGQGLEGWPTIVHGGAIGTVLDENLGRVAIRHLPERTGVTANLNVDYKAPVYSGNFYTFHASVDQERSTERKAYVTGEVRDPVGRVCARASGLFVVPKTYQLRKVGDRY